MEVHIPASSVPQEKSAKSANGFAALAALLALLAADIALFVFSVLVIESPAAGTALGVVFMIASLLILCALCICFAGLKVLAPNQAYVFTLFGKYYGTIRKPGFYFVNPFVSANAPAVMNGEATGMTMTKNEKTGGYTYTAGKPKKISLKMRTLDNRTQKVNDAMGNPIIIGSIVIWHVENPTAAVFSAENFEEYLSIQCDSTIRNIARLYPYDSMEENNPDEVTLRGASSEISDIMQDELQKRVADAGIVIEDVRITTLAYSDEIAAAMLQRQQAAAIIAARQKIVEGAVGMVKMAIDQLGEEEIVVLDEERKAAMVSNLLVVLCGNKDAQPIVNSGSIY